jgi:CDP-diacylglycerol--serine O-phosphatidyltransferase
MFSWYNEASQLSQLSDCVIGCGAYLTLIIVVFSALRLAKFNVDDTQHTEFCGLPTPANGLFCLSLAMLAQSGDITLAKEFILLISIVMACLLISPIRMFALKFKGFGWRGNELRYSFIIACIVLIAAFTKYAVPAIILIYIVISTLRWIINSHKA